MRIMTGNLNFIIFLLVTSNLVGDGFANSLELRDQCGGFCFDALKPILDHIAGNQQRWDACDAGKLVDSQSLLQRLEELQERITANEASIKEVKEKCGTPTPTTKKGIPENFEKLGSKYYYIERYHQLNWYTALNTCRQMGGHLASLQNQEELNALKKALLTNRQYWLDINDLSHEGEFMSETSGKRAQFLQWSPGEPNDHGSKEDCVGLRMLKNDESMNDAECSYKMNFICEADVNL